MIRRAFLGATAAALVAPRLALADSQGEAGVLTEAVRLEQLNVFVYDAGLKSGLLDEEGAAAFGTLRDHEQQHADALAALLEAIGGPRPKPPTDATAADASLREWDIGPLTGVRAERELLELADQLEHREVGLYVRAMKDLEDVRLIQTCASILAAEGAHRVVLRDLLEVPLVPDPFDSGF